MDFLKALQERYTTKNYDNSKSISSEVIQDLKEVLRLSPSSINSQPWEFVFVSTKEMKEELAKVSQHNTEKVLYCDTVVVFRCIDNLALFAEELEGRLPEYAWGFYKSYADNNSDEAVKNWMQKQLYISLGVFLSACATMGIDATPMEGIESEKYDKIVGDKNYKSVFAVAIGHRASNDFNQPSKKPKTRKDLHEVVREL